MTPRRQLRYAPVERINTGRIGQLVASGGKPSRNFGEIDAYEFGLQHSVTSTSKIADHAWLGIVLLVERFILADLLALVYAVHISPCVSEAFMPAPRLYALISA